MSIRFPRPVQPRGATCVLARVPCLCNLPKGRPTIAGSAHPTSSPPARHSACTAGSPIDPRIIHGDLLPNSTMPDRLNTLLRGELSAVETYELALREFEFDADTTASLRDCLRSHLRRSETLRHIICRQGGVPSDVFGIWGSLAGVLEMPPQARSRSSVIEALHRGETYARRDYEGEADQGALSKPVRVLLGTQLAPEQRRTLASVTRVLVRRSDRVVPNRSTAASRG